MNKTHWEAAGPPEYPHTIVTGCGIQGFRTGTIGTEFDDANGRNYEFSTNKRQVTCERCKASRDFKLS